MTVSIVAISARGENVSVAFEIREGEHCQKESVLLSAAQFADLGLRCGESTTEQYDAAKSASQIRQAVQRGLYLLGYGSCSAYALTRKLVAKGIVREFAEEAVAELTRRGYLNESVDALREAERCVAKRWGTKRIAEDLRAKGFSLDSVRAALYALEDAEVDWVSLCAERIRARWNEIPSDPKERQRLLATMSRYGFSTSEIREAIALVGKDG